MFLPVNFYFRDKTCNVCYTFCTLMFQLLAYVCIWLIVVSLTNDSPTDKSYVKRARNFDIMNLFIEQIKKYNVGTIPISDQKFADSWKKVSALKPRQMAIFLISTPNGSQMSLCRFEHFYFNLSRFIFGHSIVNNTECATSGLAKSRRVWRYQSVNQNLYI